MKQSSFQDTPIIAGGSLIVCSTHGNVIALDPVTGAQRWRFDPHITQEQSGAGRWICRGVADWHDRLAAADVPCAERLFLGTLDRRLIALDARTGRKCAGFGSDGEVRAVTLDRKLVVDSELQFTSPPAVVGDVVVLGSRVMDNARIFSPEGSIRAFDARTGAARWTFHTVPKGPEDPAWASWHVGIPSDRPIRDGAANVWADMSVDEARGLIYAPSTSPSVDSWGGERPGNNEYANSVLAIEGATGKLVWHFQVVHHDLFDRDLPTAPLLIDLAVGNKTVPSAVQLTKNGYIFVFDRVTGTPVFPIAERPVPQSKLPGEWTSPTQPMPVTMPVVAPNNGLQPDDAWGFTPFDRAACRRKIEKYADRIPFSPPSLEGQIIYPGFLGGANMGQRAYDPKRKLLIVSTSRAAQTMRARLRGDKPGFSGDDGPLSPYVETEKDFLLSPFGAPCSPPPWGELMAVDLENQKIVWKVTLGTIDKLAPLPIPLKLGTPSRGGPIVTAGGLIFIAATMDDRFRAFSTATGDELFNVRLPAGGQATPMTYMAGGKQYVVIAAGGHNWMKTTPGDYVIAFALED